MTTPAVAEPASTPAAPASTPGGTQTPAPAAAGTVDGTTPAAGSGGGDTPAAGQQPAGATPAPAPTSATPASTDEPKLTQKEWDEQQKALQGEADRRRTQEEWDKQSRELHTKGPVTVRDGLDDLAEKLGVSIPADLRKPIIDAFETLLSHADRGAELKFGDEFNGYKQDLQDTAVAILAQMTPEERAQYMPRVTGKEPRVWLDTLMEIKTPALRAKVAEENLSAHAALLPEGERRDKYIAAVKGVTDPAKLAQAFHDALVGVVGPGGVPQVQARGPAGTGYRTRAEVASAYNRREIDRNEYYRLRDALPA